MPSPFKAFTERAATELNSVFKGGLGALPSTSRWQEMRVCINTRIACRICVWIATRIACQILKLTKQTLYRYGKSTEI